MLHGGNICFLIGSLRIVQLSILANVSQQVAGIKTYVHGVVRMLPVVMFVMVLISGQTPDSPAPVSVANKYEIYLVHHLVSGFSIG